MGVSVNPNTRDMRTVISVLFFLGVIMPVIVESEPIVDLGTIIGSVFNTAFGRDCRGRPQGDYFFGCQCVGPFNVGRKKRSPQRSTDNRLFINSNQGLGGDLLRCGVASILN